MTEYHKALLQIPLGVLITLKYALISIVFGFLIGCLIAVLSFAKNKLLSIFARFYVSIFRGTPLLLQLSVFYFVLPSLFDVEVSFFYAAVVAFSLNSAAYVSEIIRSGINAIDVGQFEACDSLNIYGYKKYRYIILPQVFVNIIPSIINEIISLIKETALVSFFGEMDIMRRSQMVTAQYYIYLSPLCVAGITYYLIVISLSFLAKYIENKTYKYDNNNRV